MAKRESIKTRGVILLTVSLGGLGSILSACRSTDDEPIHSRLGGPGRAGTGGSGAGGTEAGGTGSGGKAAAGGTAGAAGAGTGGKGETGGSGGSGGRIPAEAGPDAPLPEGGCRASDARGCSVDGGGSDAQAPDAQARD